jgi:hypothetical protein
VYVYYACAFSMCRYVRSLLYSKKWNSCGSKSYSSYMNMFWACASVTKFKEIPFRRGEYKCFYSYLGVFCACVFGVWGDVSVIFVL